MKWWLVVVVSSLLNNFFGVEFQEIIAGMCIDLLSVQQSAVSVQ
jgi:hypothetical protein